LPRERKGILSSEEERKSLVEKEKGESVSLPVEEEGKE